MPRNNFTTRRRRGWSAGRRSARPGLGEQRLDGVEVLRSAARTGSSPRCARWSTSRPVLSCSVMVASHSAPSLARQRLWQGRPMRVAVVAGPDPGHAFPAIALCLKFLAAGDAADAADRHEWLDDRPRRGCRRRRTGRARSDRRRRRRRRGGQAPPARRADGGAERAADLRTWHPIWWSPTSITTCGGLAAELLGLPWVELNTASAVPAVEGAAAAGQRAGARRRAARPAARRGDARADRAVAARPASASEPRRASGSVCPPTIPGPLRRLIATLPALEVPRPDWPAEAVVVGPLHFEPTTSVLEVPPGDGPVVVVAPSTATTGDAGAGRAGAGDADPG